MATPEQLAANRANAQLSTGPTSSEGKVKISHNALKTGLTGRTVLLPSDDVAAYQAHVQRIFNEYGPVTDEEKRLAHSIADTLWRLERIPVLEAGIYAIGRRELAAQFADEPDEAVRKVMRPRFSASRRFNEYSKRRSFSPIAATSTISPSRKTGCAACTRKMKPS